MKIACWSGPRNLSTAMMYAFGNRADFAAMDEPFYAAYLARTGLEHPMRKAIITHHEADPAQVIRACTTPYTGGVFYQKHMTHHLLPDYPLDWLAQLSHCFLLRDPHEVLLSYAQKREQVTLEDIGLPQQLEIFEHVQARTGQIPLVIDSADFLQQPGAYLQALCEQLAIPFSERMLHWPAGERASDGVWARYWYAAVQKSTGFAPYRPRQVTLPPELQDIAAQAAPYYQTLHRVRLQL